MYQQVQTDRLKNNWPTLFKTVNIIKDKEEAGELFQIKDMWRDMTNKCNA